MLPGNGGADFDRLLRDTRRSLESLRTDPSRPDRDRPAGAPSAQGIGEAYEGQVRAVAVDGRLESLELESRLMRLAPEQLAPHLVAAANAALDDLSAKAPVSDTDAVADPAVLADRLGEVANEGLARMASISQGLIDAMARISRQAHISGEPGDQGLEYLLTQAQHAARAVAGATAADDAAPDDAPDTAPDDATELRGAGADADGQISAVAGGGGRLELVQIDPRAMRAGSYELGQRVIAAVNAALEDVRSQARERAVSAAGRQDIAERVRVVQDLSLQHMRTYSQALGALMSGIERR